MEIYSHVLPNTTREAIEKTQEIMQEVNYDI